MNRLYHHHSTTIPHPMHAPTQVPTVAKCDDSTTSQTAKTSNKGSRARRGRPKPAGMVSLSDYIAPSIGCYHAAAAV